MGESITALLLEWQVRGDAASFSRCVAVARPIIEHSAARHLQAVRRLSACRQDEVVARVLDHLRRLHPPAPGERSVARFRSDPDGDAAAGVRYLRWVTRRRTQDVLRQERRLLRRAMNFTEAGIDGLALANLSATRHSIWPCDDLGERLRTAIAALPIRQRDVMTMLLQGASQVGIARALGVCEATVSRCRGDAVTQLKTMLVADPPRAYRSAGEGVRTVPPRSMTAR